MWGPPGVVIAETVGGHERGAIRSVAVGMLARVMHLCSHGSITVAQTCLGDRATFAGNDDEIDYAKQWMGFGQKDRTERTIHIPLGGEQSMKYIVHEKFFRMGEDNDILDESGQPVYRVDGKVLSLHNLMIVNDLNGTELARVHRKILALLSHYEIEFKGQDGMTEVHQRFSSPLHPKWTISEPGQPDLTMTGNFFGHDFSIEKDGQPLATVSKKWLSVTDSYGVDIVDGQNDLLLLCSVLALEAEQDRKERSN